MSLQHIKDKPLLDYPAVAPAGEKLRQSVFGLQFSILNFQSDSMAKSVLSRYLNPECHFYESLLLVKRGRVEIGDSAGIPVFYSSFGLAA